MAVDPPAKAVSDGVPKVRWPWKVAAAGLCCLLVFLTLWWFVFRIPVEKQNRREPSEFTFDGNSAELKQTIIVPTLDTPFPQNKSAIWCSSFQIAWNQFKNDLVKGPIRLRNAELVADRLNRAPQSKANLVPGSYYTAAGWVKEGIISQIEQEMAGKFPGVPRPKFDGLSDEAAVAYAYIQAMVKFKHAFSDNHEVFEFRDSARKTKEVRSFGILEKEKDQGDSTYRGQVSILFRSGDEFALDLCKFSEPNQIVVACMQRKETLAGTLADLQSRMKKPLAKKDQSLGGNSLLLVPNMQWRITHQFLELKGKRFLNTGFEGHFVAIALQSTEFNLRRSGVELQSSGALASDWNGDQPEKFYFEKPFLIYMKKRGASYPFFVMWVDNAELMQKP